jgi:hypothetical protein
MNTLSRKIALAILGGAALLFSILLACALGQAYYSRAEGYAFLSDVRGLRVGQSTYDDILRIQTKYKSYSSVEGNRCDRDLCDVDFLSGNKWLYELGLVPGAMFTGGVRVRGGVLTRISVGFLSGPPNMAPAPRRSLLIQALAHMRSTEGSIPVRHMPLFRFALLRLLQRTSDRKHTRITWRASRNSADAKTPTKYCQSLNILSEVDSGCRTLRS